MFRKWEVARIPFANTTALYSSLLPAGNINTWQTFHCSISKAFCCSPRTALSFLLSFSFAAYRFKERNTFGFVSCWQPIKASPLFSLEDYQSDAELWWHFWSCSYQGLWSLEFCGSLKCRQNPHTTEFFNMSSSCGVGGKEISLLVSPRLSGLV